MTVNSVPVSMHTHSRIQGSEGGGEGGREGGRERGREGGEGVEKEPSALAHSRFRPILGPLEL